MITLDITNVDIVKSREEKFLSLRKKQINNFIFSKRFLSDPDENLKIDPKQLNLLPENLIDVDYFMRNVKLTNIFIFLV